MIPSRFFPGGICYFFSEEKKDKSILSENEWMIVQKYGTKRLADFCTGRYCMRKCTEQLGFSGDILIGDRGMPLLPNHITASLSHSKNLCGAIAGDKDLFLSLGLDIETCGRVHKKMWYLLFTKNEIEYLNSLDDEQQDFISTVFFSLKEAFYKLQYPLTGIFLDFPEVEIVMINNRFYVKMLRHVTSLFAEGRLIQGSILKYYDQVITYCSLPVKTKFFNTGS